jgi:hypothetical protein
MLELVNYLLKSGCPAHIALHIVANTLVANTLVAKTQLKNLLRLTFYSKESKKLQNKFDWKFVLTITSVTKLRR